MLTESIKKALGRETSSIQIVVGLLGMVPNGIEKRRVCRD